MIYYRIIVISLFLFGGIIVCYAQPFLLGADLSYINEMEDCGATYYEQGVEQDPYSIFSENECQLVRLRLWHTPSWYDTLNNGLRYSDLSDVKKSIDRSHSHNMSVLLDFHLSDFWADPSRQWVPESWVAVVDDLSVLQDSLYLYIYTTLEELQQEDLMPEIIQIGNETNRGILQSVEDNEAGWSLDWERNSALFNTAIQAVKDIESEFDLDLDIALHIAGPADVTYYFEEFLANGVTDFDIIGFSYYWQWHQPSTIEDVAAVIEFLRNNYPAYEVMLLETGYLWTTNGDDSANNIINSIYPTYQTVSPNLQLEWLTELSQAALNAGVLGIIYWEPAWVSTSCHTPWAQGSHYENATFFDFDNQVLEDGGINFFSFPYQINNLSDALVDRTKSPAEIYADGSFLHIAFSNQPLIRSIKITITDVLGRTLSLQHLRPSIDTLKYQVPITELPAGQYYVVLEQDDLLLFSGTFFNKD